MIVKRILFTLFLAGLFFSCDLKEKDNLRSEVDSLRSELVLSQQMAQTLEEVGVLMDSIDANRDVLRTSMIEGTTYDEYSARMKDINSYIKETKYKIVELEKSLKSSKSSTNSYAAALKKVKADLNSMSEEYAVLQKKVEEFRNENENLVQTVELQKTELNDKIEKIQERETEVAKLEVHINEMLEQSKIDEAEAYFLQAQALETAADRTKFAPRKKKATQKEALELYRLAVFYGKPEAEQKVKELEKEVG